MRIVVDARWIFPEISGIGLYTQELIRAWSSMTDTHTFILLFQSDAIRRRTLGPTDGRFETIVPGYGLFDAANQLRLPALLRRLRADVYHSTNWMMPLLGDGSKRVLTIHDLIPLLFREHAPRSRKARLFPLYKALMRRFVHQADRIIVPSQSTRRDLVQHLAADPARIVVTVEGVRPEFTPEQPASTRPPHILFVGRRDPYKNLPLLIEAFAEVHALRPDARLQVIGPDDPRYPEARDRARALRLEQAIEWTGYVSPEALAEAYRKARVFVLPSRYEGFGLTVIEAMASGTPVVCSNSSSLPEVAGHAALLCPVGDRSALTQAILRVLSDDALAQSMRERGLQQVQPFTWADAARQTLAVYEGLGPR